MTRQKQLINTYIITFIKTTTKEKLILNHLDHISDMLSSVWYMPKKLQKTHLFVF